MRDIYDLYFKKCMDKTDIKRYTSCLRYEIPGGNRPVYMPD